MKRSYAVSVFFVLCTLIIPFSASAVTVDQPHAGVTSSYSCSTCHTNHLSLNSDATGFNNICQTCHRVGDSAAGSKPITSADAANPYKNHSSYGIQKSFQTSHRWDGPMTEPRAGAQMPIQSAMTSVTTLTSGQMACTVCHNQHSNANGKFLRMNNTSDTMCMDCHRTRAVTSHLQGSHPVNVPMPATAAFNNPPKNANPANPTSDLGLRLAKSGGNVVCSTCHSVHYTDSRSSTFDGFSSAAGRGRNFYNLSTGDGYLLRTDRRGQSVPAGNADNLNICTNCHAGKTNHNYKNQNIQCTDCHGAHVEYDPNDPTNTKGTNVDLIRRNVTKFGQPQQILFRYTGSRREYVNSTNTGVCQGCHDVPAPGGVYPQEHASADPSVCGNCHYHGNTHGSFAGACNNCHGHPPTTASIGTGDGIASPATNAAGGPGAHSLHVEQRGMDCSTCHNGYSGRSMPNSTIDIGFGIDAAKFPGFKSVANSGVYGNTNVLGTATNGKPYTFAGDVDTTGTIAPNQTCANVYCHGATLKNGSGVNTGSITKPNWTITDGTQAQCDACHGVFGEGPGTAGHTRHAGSGPGDLNMGCDNCHGTLPSVTSSGGWYGPNHVNGVVDWDVSPLGAPQVGSPQPAYKATNGVFVTKGATNTLPPSAAYGSCNNIYCHSNVQGPGGTGAPTSFNSPVWGGAAMTCGSCHVNMASDPAATGSHIKHAQAYNIACGTCHTGYTATSTNPNTHAKNTAVDVIFPGTGISAGGKYNNTNAGGKAPGSGYASCTTSYCHSNSGPNNSPRAYPATAPVWGGAALNCGSCHLNMATDSVATGSHYAHASNANASGPQYGCETCHAGYTATSVNIATHVDQKVNLNFAVPTTYSKVAPIAAGTTWGSCSASKCHGQGSVTWGTALWSTTEQCAKCHSSMATVTSSGTFYSTSFPVKQTSNTDSKVGAHVSHLTGTDSLSASLVCSDCHGTVALKDANHMNGTTNFAWSALATKNGTLTPSISNGSCSNVYCHGASMPNGDTSGTNRTPTWNVPFLPATLTPAACGTCHGFPPTSHASYGVTTPTSFPMANCSACHPNVSSTATTYATIFVNKSLHINGIVDVSGNGGCNGCHGYPPANKRFKGTQNNWSSARAENYSGAGGAHTVAGHIPPTASPSQGFSMCTNCHNASDHVTNPIAFTPSSNIKVSVSQRLRFSNIAQQAKYSSNRLDGAAHIPGRCSNVACHFQKTPRW